jgi:hypothetical protein
VHPTASCRVHAGVVHVRREACRHALESSNSFSDITVRWQCRVEVVGSGEVNTDECNVLVLEPATGCSQLWARHGPSWCWAQAHLSIRDNMRVMLEPQYSDRPALLINGPGSLWKAAQLRALSMIFFRYVTWARGHGRADSSKRTTCLDSLASDRKTVSRCLSLVVFTKKRCHIAADCSVWLKRPLHATQPFRCMYPALRDFISS